MCQFFSFYLDQAGRVYATFPFESHSETPHPADAVPLETTLANGAVVIDEDQHPLPAWFTAEHRAAILRRYAEAEAEVSAYRTTSFAKRLHAANLRLLRGMFPDPQQRACVVQNAGGGDPETALRHVQHVRLERRMLAEQLDGLTLLKRRAGMKWLAGLSDDYLRQQLAAANHGARVRRLTLTEIKEAIAAATTGGGKPCTVGDWKVAHAYRQRGRPYGTFARILYSDSRPLVIYRSAF